jgi:hypothetical protein
MKSTAGWPSSSRRDQPTQQLRSPSLKRLNKVVAKPVVEDASTVRILKRATCPSVSGKSTLVFEVGLDEQSKALRLRVVSNSGGGRFSPEWVAVDAIRAYLDKAPKAETVTSHVLAPLFRGVSQNTAGFVWAVLVHAGFVVPSATKKRCYDRVEPNAFKEEVQALIEGKVPTQSDAKPKKNAGKKAAPAKTPSASTKKAE